MFFEYGHETLFIMGPRNMTTGRDNMVGGREVSCFYVVPAGANNILIAVRNGYFEIRVGEFR